jgi:PHD-finger
MKRALRKYSAMMEHHHDWDLQLPWIAMGYRMSKQKALGSFSPYEILFGRSPDLPFSVRAQVEPAVDFDDPEVLRQVMHDRAEVFKHRVPAAWGNLRIAQHRDQLWYARLQGGGYMPQLRRFRVGDLVYMQRQVPSTLDIKAGRNIYRVIELLPSGRVRLQGKDGLEFTEMARNCAPCHLPVDVTVDPSLARIPAGKRCRYCGESSGAALMLICDICGNAWHTFCLDPPMEELPEGLWFCPNCTQRLEAQARKRPRLEAAETIEGWGTKM